MTNAIPGSLYGSLEGLSVATKLSPRSDPLGILAQMGYPDLKVATGRFDLTWNQANTEIALDKLSADMPNIGSFEIAATATGAGPDLFSTEPAVEQAAALWLRLKQVDATVRNAGFFEKLIDYVAKDKGSTPEAIRDKLIQQATVELPDNLGGGRAARQIGAALGQFIKQPRSLHVSVGSSGGLGFAELPLLRSPSDLLDRLDVSVTANQ